MNPWLWLYIRQLDANCKLTDQLQAQGDMSDSHFKDVTIDMYDANAMANMYCLLFL